MRVLTQDRHGLTLGTAPLKNNHNRAKRGIVGGWSPSSTRNNTKFLRSIFEPDLHEKDGRVLQAFALTLTLKNCPDTADDFHTLRRSLEHRYRRLCLIRMHWVIEWQKRGVPHLHAAVWFDSDDEYLQMKIIDHWLQLAKPYTASPFSQHATRITDAIGWFQYMAKHASRGVGHYQRSPENIPEQWKQKTGRVWGKIGDWPVQEAVKFTLTGQAFYEFRRIIRNWRIADARANVKKYNKKRIVTARQMLKCHNRNLSHVRGVSEWIPENTQMQILHHLTQNGHSITC